MPSLHELLAKKNLSTDLFQTTDEIKLKMPIEALVAWIFNTIYSKPYPGMDKPTEIARQIHGIQHTTRVAIYISLFANLYALFGDKEALALNDEDIKLLQIAALFHDSAREDEEVDHWDQESALFFYHYATNILQLDPLKAKLLAEALANKDADRRNYFELINSAWVKRGRPVPKNIYQKLIHDADCLDIIRAQDHFDARYLDFYKYIAYRNQEALDLMAKLITEARSLIANQGDARRRLNISIKLKFEHQDAYKAIMNFIDDEKNKALYPLIRALSKRISNSVPNSARTTKWQELNIEGFIPIEILAPTRRSLTVLDTLEDTEESLTQAMYSGRLFARGVGSPSGINPSKIIDEYNAALETRKMLRVMGVPTRTTKPDNIKKWGNPNRSVTMLGFGAGLYASQGFLILNPKMEQISDLCVVDFDTERGKKKELELPPYDPKAREKELKRLHRELKMGGKSRLFWHDYPTTHNEILYRITQADAVYFTQDPTPYNEIMYENDLPCNPHTHYLQALFLQIEYEKDTGKKLPIFEYSGVHNFIKKVRIYSEEEIIDMWVEMISKLLNDKTNAYWIKSLETLKILAIDGYIGNNNLVKRQVALDINYPLDLQKKINTALENERTMCIRKMICSGQRLRNVFKLPLEELNSEERELIWAAVKGRLGVLINKADNLQHLLDLSLIQLTTKQREEIWTALEGLLGALITNTDQLYRLLALPIEKLNAVQRDSILNALYDQLGTIIIDGDHLIYLLKLPFEKLNPLQEDRIFTAIESHLPILIKDGSQLRNLLLHVNNERQEWLVAVLESQLPNLVKDAQQLIFVLMRANEGRIGLILSSFEDQLATLIKDENQLSRLLLCCDSKQKNRVLELVGDSFTHKICLSN